MARVRWLVVSWLLAVGCTPPDGSARDLSPAPDLAAPPRRIETTVTLTGGLSAPLELVVPANTRSLTVVAVGDDHALYALGSLRTPDGVEHVTLAPGPPAMELQQQYYGDQVPVLPTGLYQTIRVGTFTHVYPYAPGQLLAPGPMSLRIASSAMSGQVAVTLLLPEDDGGRVLHLNALSLISVGAPPPATGWLAPLQTIFQQAGIRIVLDEVQSVTSAEFSNLGETPGTLPEPGDVYCRLALAGHGWVMSDALNVFIVESLPGAIGGFTLGLPGPPVPSSYDFGVVVRAHADDAEAARAIGHEVAHFLNLHHVQDLGTFSGTAYPDPLDDTTPGQPNLMDGTGTTLTAGQAFSLSKSPLLAKQ
jgi:hypothetical protein